MRHYSDLDPDPVANELYLAGERVPSGVYKQCTSGREVRLDHEDYLPASLDGRVACYIRLKHQWGQPGAYRREAGQKSRP